MLDGESGMVERWRREEGAKEGRISNMMQESRKQEARSELSPTADALAPCHLNLYRIFDVLLK